MMALYSFDAMTAIGCVLVTYAFLRAVLYFTQDSREPPMVMASIPFVSPILGMIRESMDFYPQMRERYRGLPIYTLRLPGTRIYAINSLELIPVVQRAWRTLIFAPIQVQAAQAAMGVSKATVAIMNRDLVTENGFVNGMVKATHPTMSNGPSLDRLNGEAFRVFNKTLEQIESNSTVTVPIFRWVESQTMLATTDAVYGPANPMRDTRNLDAWHQYHPALMYMMLDILPQKLFFGAAIQAREELVKNFTKYYADESYKRGSDYIQKFTQHCISQGIPEMDIPRMLLGTVFNNVANSVPSAFWVIYHIFSDRYLLQEIRDEVEQNAVVTNGEKGATDGIATIDLSRLTNPSYCPILLSTYHEVFRYHGMANSVRVVSEDHLLDGRFLLKKGGLVVMSARAQHRNPAVWGPDVDDFCPHRFMSNKESYGEQGPRQDRINPVAFRGFGGGRDAVPGTPLCNGRDPVTGGAAGASLRY
ncbi:cytochrome P450 [Apiospora sp. TS-2023a]